ncbi:hypothetical protein EYF80_045510 [Liparis tanakae]|uniref:Uncharacterized protein n=1 Tax=Liparis tanakae TaxID=230148 RepID=A0A4Z2FTX2_9TELE|nr:hypothetical protein EYF80_045510 [Liparis tanakae]
MPSDRAEPTMLLTTFSRETFLILKHSSRAFTWAISYTARTDTMPAVSVMNEPPPFCSSCKAKQSASETDG